MSKIPVSVGSIFILFVWMHLTFSVMLPLEDEHIPKDVICYDGPFPMEGLIPNPRLCNNFYICREISLGKPEPVIMPCQQGGNGTLFYDFLDCQCKEKENARCFTQADKDQFFICAHKLGE